MGGESLLGGLNEEEPKADCPNTEGLPKEVVPKIGCEELSFGLELTRPDDEPLENEL